MSDSIRQMSLFSSTSAFNVDEQALAQQREELARTQALARHANVVTAFEHRIAKIAELLEEACVGTTEDEMRPSLEEALELARKYA